METDDRNIFRKELLDKKITHLKRKERLKIQWSIACSQMLLNFQDTYPLDYQLLKRSVEFREMLIETFRETLFFLIP